MKKILALAAAAAMLLTATACAKGGSQSDKPVLKVGAEISYPPFEYFDADGTTPIGIDIELAKALGEKMDYEVEFVNTGWDGIFAGLQKGDYDVIISAVTITPDRLVDFDFSDPYIQNYQSIITLADAATKPASPAELAGLKVGYQEETTSDIYITDYAAANGIALEPFEYASVMNAFDDLSAGRVDAVICDSTVAQKYLADTKFEETWIQSTEPGAVPEEFAVCINKGNDELKSKINAALAEVKADGTLDSIFNTYF